MCIRDSTSSTSSSPSSSSSYSSSSSSPSSYETGLRPPPPHSQKVPVRRASCGRDADVSQG
eukprot:861690-Pyramimonas_sp.AAC.1